MSERFLHDDMLLTTPTSRQLLPRRRGRAPDRRRPHAPEPRRHRVGPRVDHDRRAVALGRSLQVAGDAPRRRARRAHHRRRGSVGSVPSVGGDDAASGSQPALRLDAPRAASRVRHRHRARRGHCEGDLGRDEPAPAEPVGAALLARFLVELVATTDDPGDPLDAHRRLAADTLPPRMVPTFRPDQAHSLLADPTAWCSWVDRLGHTEGHAVSDLESLLACLTSVHARFAAVGCRVSDHGLACVPDRPRDPRLADKVVRGARDGRAATDDEREAGDARGRRRSRPGSRSRTTPCCSSTSGRCATSRPG